MYRAIPLLLASIFFVHAPAFALQQEVAYDSADESWSIAAMLQEILTDEQKAALKKTGQSPGRGLRMHGRQQHVLSLAHMRAMQHLHAMHAKEMRILIQKSRKDSTITRESVQAHWDTHQKAITAVLSAEPASRKEALELTDEQETALLELRETTQQERGNRRAMREAYKTYRAAMAEILTTQQLEIVAIHGALFGSAAHARQTRYREHRGRKDRRHNRRRH